MDKVNFWQRLLKIVISCIIAYIAIGYIVFATVVLHYEISLLPDDELIYTAVDKQKRFGSLSTRVHNVTEPTTPRSSMTLVYGLSFSFLIFMCFIIIQIYFLVSSGLPMVQNNLYTLIVLQSTILMVTSSWTYLKIRI